MKSTSRSIVKKSKLWVIKIGSSILTAKRGKPDPQVFARIVRDVAALRKAGKKVILVSSGAIACGMHKMGMKKKPANISQKQAIAAAGQITLMDHYAKAFAKHRLQIAQILLTREDVHSAARAMNARHAIHELLKMGIVPIINENDTVAVEEIKVGDNDNLSAHVARLVEAQLLVILTDQDGLYTSDPRVDVNAEKISLVQKLDKKIHRLAQDTQGQGTTGGMITKLQAAEHAIKHRVATVIASGLKEKMLQSLAKGNEEGTLFLPAKGL